jgi:hypothetical protein
VSELDRRREKKKRVSEWLEGFCVALHASVYVTGGWSYLGLGISHPSYSF